MQYKNILRSLFQLMSIRFQVHYDLAWEKKVHYDLESYLYVLSHANELYTVSIIWFVIK